MTTKKDIREDLARVAHASQLKATVEMLLAYLDEAGVSTPAEKEAQVNEQRHQQVAQAQTVDELDAVVEGWGADFKPDADLERAVDQRDAYLAQQEAADQAAAEQPGVETGEYPSWTKTKLQAEARARGLATSGTVAELADRLVKDDQKRAVDEQASTQPSA